MGQEANDEGDGEKDPTSDETLPDPSELELLQEIIDPASHNQPPPAPKSGNKRGPSHLDGGSASSDSSVEDLDAKGAHPKKKGSTPMKASVLQSVGGRGHRCCASNPLQDGYAAFPNIPQEQNRSWQHGQYKHQRS